MLPKDNPIYKIRKLTDLANAIKDTNDCIDVSITKNADKSSILTVQKSPADFTETKESNVAETLGISNAHNDSRHLEENAENKSEKSPIILRPINLQNIKSEAFSPPVNSGSINSNNVLKLEDVKTERISP